MRKRAALKLNVAALKKGSLPAVNKEEMFCVPSSFKLLSSRIITGILSVILSFKSSITNESVFGAESLRVIIIESVWQAALHDNTMHKTVGVNLVIEL